jgi:hypothetical protein
VWVHRIHVPVLLPGDGVAPDVLSPINDFATAAAAELERIRGWAEPDLVFAPIWDVEGIGILRETDLPVAVHVSTPLAVIGPMAGFLAELPMDHHHVFEFRDPSWWRDDIYRLLTDRSASFVCFDLAGLRSPRLTTSARAYVRLHGFERAYQGRYPLPVLADWAGWLGAQRAAGSEAWVYLDNTMLADDALCDARTLDSMLAADSGC